MSRIKAYAPPAVGLTALALAARFFPLPPLTDAATGLPFPGARLEPTWGHLLLAPLSAAADAVVCASARQHAAGLFFSICAFWAFLRWADPERGTPGWKAPAHVAGSFALATAAALAFWAWAVLGPRPVDRLVLDDPAALAADFHSHTSFSWDGRRSFTPERNAAWHAARGYGAAFVTDHNTTASRERARRAEGAALLAGSELSLHGAHVLVLGGLPPQPEPYQDGLPGLERALRRGIPDAGGLSVMSLPEYWKHHEGNWETLADWGAAGFELVSAAPKALDFPPEMRREVVELCRRRNLFLTGGTDNHGWASGACAWTILRLDDWRSLPKERLEEEILKTLRNGFASTTVLTRTARAAVSQGEWLIWLDFPRALFTTARTWTGSQLAVFLAWVWLPVLFLARSRK